MVECHTRRCETVWVFARYMVHSNVAIPHGNVPISTVQIVWHFVTSSISVTCSRQLPLNLKPGVMQLYLNLTCKTFVSSSNIRSMKRLISHDFGTKMSLTSTGINPCLTVTSLCSLKYILVTFDKPQTTTRIFMIKEKIRLIVQQ